MEQNILTILGVVIALAEIAVAICKYSQETRQKKRYDTIKAYNELFENGKALLEG